MRCPCVANTSLSSLKTSIKPGVRTQACRERTTWPRSLIDPDEFFLFFKNSKMAPMLAVPSPSVSNCWKVWKRRKMSFLNLSVIELIDGVNWRRNDTNINTFFSRAEPTNCIKKLGQSNRFLKKSIQTFSVRKPTAIKMDVLRFSVVSLQAFEAADANILEECLLALRLCSNT